MSIFLFTKPGSAISIKRVIIIHQEDFNMDILQALILGVVQGLTEFLPISSSGHLLIFQKLMEVDMENIVTFDLALHFATLIAVVAVLWRDVWEMIRHPFSKLTLLVVVGTIPTVVIGFLFMDTFESLLQSGISVGIEFLFTGVILLYAESVNHRQKRLEEMKFSDAVVVGISQGVAILPAVSRSGLTLAGSLFRGLNREFALRFSFLMSIPAILGPVLLDIVDFIQGDKVATLGMDPTAFILGMLAAAVSGYLAVRFMLRIFTKWSLKVFSYYVFAIGLLVLIDQLFFQRYFPALF
jgi:undecaprenyl-diphosphatase